MAHCLNGTDKLRPKYRARNLSRCHFAHHKPYRTILRCVIPVMCQIDQT